MPCRPQFYSKWLKEGDSGRPKLLRVYQIRNPADVYAEYETYVGQVEDDEGQGVNRRFHGTSAECDIGIDQNAPPCSSPTCAVCIAVRVKVIVTILSKVYDSNDSKPTM